MDIRHDWTREEARSVHDLPLPDLIFHAQRIHRKYNDPCEIQLCALLSIKTGRCSEDCAYCSQSAHYDTPVEDENILDVDAVLEAAAAARERGASRFCMGAAWREVREGPDFEKVLEMVRGVSALGIEACCTLGMLAGDQARRLAEAGLKCYNHNLDTGPVYYGRIVTTHTFEDRLETLRRIREAGITICSGGIIGMGESVDDRMEMLCVLAGFDPHPENVPINALVPIPGTPLEKRPRVPPLEVVRMIATARILLPRARVRLSAGRLEMSPEAQALSFVAGANSIFSGDRLLTTGNPDRRSDSELLASLGLRSSVRGGSQARPSSVDPAAHPVP
ncbi:MAG: biotin synthase BioB [Planctomycetes bacterium]|nr:biotin synthase BioB [Planctomycetota bacterium]